MAMPTDIVAVASEEARLLCPGCNGLKTNPKHSYCQGCYGLAQIIHNDERELEVAEMVRRRRELELHGQPCTLQVLPTGGPIETKRFLSINLAHRAGWIDLGSTGWRAKNAWYEDHITIGYWDTYLERQSQHNLGELLSTWQQVYQELNGKEGILYGEFLGTCVFYVDTTRGLGKEIAQSTAGRIHQAVDADRTAMHCSM